MVKKIALEEHFLCPDFIEYWNPTVVDLPVERRDKALTRLSDFGELRLAAMDEAGIARAVIGLAGPGVQAERDSATAIGRARGQRFSGAPNRTPTRSLFGICPPGHAGSARRRRRARTLHA